MKVAFDAMMNLHYLKMGKDETIPEFYRRAQTAKEIVDKTLGGPIKLTALITAEKQAANQNQAFLATIIKANREAAFDRCMAFVLIHKAYKPKFGSLMQRLEDAQCTRITGRESSDYRSALVEIFDVYEAQGFNVARIHADQEFRSTIVALQQEGKMLSFNLANAQEHQPQAERNNRTIQERLRAQFHSQKLVAHNERVLQIKDAAADANQRRTAAGIFTPDISFWIPFLVLVRRFKEEWGTDYVPKDIQDATTDVETVHGIALTFPN
jgi:hypothetical protein